MTIKRWYGVEQGWATGCLLLMALGSILGTQSRSQLTVASQNTRILKFGCASTVFPLMSVPDSHMSVFF